VRTSDAADLRENCFSMNTLEQVEARLADNIRLYEEGNGIRLVAEVDGRVVGTVMLTRHTHPLFAHRAQLDDVVVHGDYRRRGIARRLVAESRAHARAMGIEILEVNCRAGTEAEQVYPRLGFVEYGRLPRGIVEPWNEGAAFDQVFYFHAIEPAP
jgi:GNAT superfamily N-acetyltransferase